MPHPEITTALHISLVFSMHTCMLVFIFVFNHLGMRSTQGQGSMAEHGGVPPCPVHSGVAREKLGEQNKTGSQTF